MHAGLRRRRARVQITVATLSGNSLRQTVHTHRASVHQAAKLVAAVLRVAGVTAGLAESNGSLPPGLWLTPPAGWLPRTGISSGTLCSVINYGLPFLLSHICTFTRYNKPLQTQSYHCYFQLLPKPVFFLWLTWGNCNYAQKQNPWNYSPFITSLIPSCHPIKSMKSLT